MGRARLRKCIKHRNTENHLPKQQWRDLIVLTAQLLGAEFSRDKEFFRSRSTHEWVCDGVYASERWKCARDWLWRRQSMVVRKDGSIYATTKP